jgi:hypothetical protein
MDNISSTEESHTKSNRKKIWIKDLENIHSLIKIILISGWISIAVIFCYIAIVDYAIHKLPPPYTEIHWNIAVSLFIIILASSFILQAVLIETDNKNDFKNKIVLELSYQHKEYIKRKNEPIQKDEEKSKDIDENKKYEIQLEDIINYLAERDSYFLYTIYRKIQSRLKISNGHQNIKEKDLKKDSIQNLINQENKNDIIKEFCNFHIPDALLEFFVGLRIENDGLSFKYYIMPLSFFLFSFFAGFLIVLPMINSVLHQGSNLHQIPLYNLFHLFQNIGGIPLLIIQFGFLGGFVYTSIDLLRRFNRKDLPPRVYYNASYKLILAVAAAVIVFLFLSVGANGSINNNGNTNATQLQITPMTYSALLLSFSIGILPIQFL